MTRSTVIVAGARTPMGRLLGSLTDIPAPALGGVAIRGAIDRAGISPADVQYVVLGQVLQAGCGQAPYRQAAVHGGIPMTVPATGVSKVCLSGMDAILHADLLIRAGLFDVVVAGGMESMTRAPRLLTDSRAGRAFGDLTAADHMALDGLYDSFTDQGMGPLTEAGNTGAVAVDRVACDEFAARSHQLAARAWKDGVFDDEVVPVPVPQRRGDPIEFATDEGIRPDTTVESLARLRPAFTADGVITAGNASQISDGACALVLMDKQRAERDGISWIAEIGSAGLVSGPDSGLQEQPSNAILDACAREGIGVGDLDLVEINEAFAAVALSSQKALGLDLDRLNINGGAIAMGHPIGMSGARIVLHLANALQRRGGGVGAAALCGGGGQGEALIVRTG